jgi:RNA polymerase sigma factor (sigma-70 family)
VEKPSDNGQAKVIVGKKKEDPLILSYLEDGVKRLCKRYGASIMTNPRDPLELRDIVIMVYNEAYIIYHSDNFPDYDQKKWQMKSHYAFYIAQKGFDKFRGDNTRRVVRHVVDHSKPDSIPIEQRVRVGKQHASLPENFDPPAANGNERQIEISHARQFRHAIESLELSDFERDIIKLHFDGEVTLKEVAEKLARTLEAVNKATQRLKAKIKERLPQYDPRWLNEETE